MFFFPKKLESWLKLHGIKYMVSTQVSFLCHHHHHHHHQISITKHQMSRLLPRNAARVHLLQSCVSLISTFSNNHVIFLGFSSLLCHHYHHHRHHHHCHHLQSRVLGNCNKMSGEIPFLYFNPTDFAFFSVRIALLAFCQQVVAFLQT